MKKVFISILILLSVSSVFSQRSKIERWNVGVGLSGMTLLYPLDVSSPNIFETRGAQVYSQVMPGKKLGFSFNASYNPIRFKEQYTTTNFFNLSIHTLADLNEIFNIDKRTNWFSRPRYSSLNINPNLASYGSQNVAYRKFDYYAHLGFGWSGMHQEYKKIHKDNPLLDSFDDMLELSFGIMPQYLIDRNWSVCLDITYNLHFMQSRPYDFEREQKNPGIDGSYLGIVFSINLRLDNLNFSSYPMMY